MTGSWLKVVWEPRIGLDDCVEAVNRVKNWVAPGIGLNNCVGPRVMLNIC